MTKTNDTDNSQLKNTDQKEKCGIVMPISECDGCTEDHWQEVKEIIKRAAEDAGYEAFLVSEADDYGVIQKRIVQNLYDCPIVVCDISGRNANVMFELGMRLAFDKNTIIIKDDKTPFSFDTSPIEHVPYPRDLRFSKIEKFQKQLAEKIRKAQSLSGENSFLKSFGDFKVAQLDVQSAPLDAFLLDEFQILKRQISALSRHIKGFEFVPDKNLRFPDEKAMGRRLGTISLPPNIRSSQISPTEYVLQIDKDHYDVDELLRGFEATGIDYQVTADLEKQIHVIVDAGDDKNSINAANKIWGVSTQSLRPGN